MTIGGGDVFVCVWLTGDIVRDVDDCPGLGGKVGCPDCIGCTEVVAVGLAVTGGGAGCAFFGFAYTGGDLENKSCISSNIPARLQAFGG